MRTLKIRFIEEDSKYTIQVWKWFRWQTQYESAEPSINSDGDVHLFCKSIKNIDTSRCLHRYLYLRGIDKKKVRIIEYPTLRIY